MPIIIAMSVVSFVSSARERFSRRIQSLFSRGAALIACILISWTSAAADVELSGPSVTIDYDQLPIISLYAKSATIREIITQLADRLHFQVDNPEAVGNSRTLSGVFKGELTDVLRRLLLRDVSYVILYRDLAIDRILVVGLSTAGFDVPKTSWSENVAATEGMEGTAIPIAERTSGPFRSSTPGQAVQSVNPLARLLQTQANIMQRTGTETGSGAATDNTRAAMPSASAMQSSASSTATRMSLAAMTQTAQTNVQMLVKALNSVCIGPSCAQ